MHRQSGILLVIFIIIVACTTEPQVPSCIRVHQDFVDAQNMSFADPEESPLPEDEQADFEYLNYYDYDGDYCVIAKLVKTPDEEPFEMPTSTERLPKYIKYGELHFSAKGEVLQLSAYQNLSLMEEVGYEDYLFVPFNDLSNGVTSYGGGRYLDLRIPAADSLEIDLNNTYHPYCAYNHRYSCPIPPAENMLDVAIEAGVKLGVNGVMGE